jgi:DNA-binding NtrC family response regulator
VKHYSAKHGRKLNGVAAPALALLRAYDYPGNARELGNIIERLVIVATGKSIDERDLPLGLSAAVKARKLKEKPRTLAEMEAAYIAEVLARTNGNKTECARILGISRKNLYEKIARYDLRS